MINSSLCIKSVDRNLTVSITIRITPKNDRNPLTNTITQYDMEKSERINTINRFEDILSMLNALSDLQTKELAESINKYGVNLSINKIEKLTGLSATSGKATHFRGALSNLIHNYRDHKTSFEKDLQETKVPKELLSTFKTFLGRLNQKGIDALNTRFQILQTSEEYILRSFGSQTYLKEIIDDDDNVIGLMPILRVLIEVEDDINETTETRRIDLDPEMCETFLKGVMNMKEEFFTAVKNYKAKMGDLLLYSEEE